MRIIFSLLTLSLSFSTLQSASNYNEKASAPWGVDEDLYCKTLKISDKKACKESSSSLLPILNITQTLSSHEPENPEKNLANSFQKSSCIAMIRFFQLYISPIDGPRSSFYPTSSQYALESIREHGVFKGIALGCDRLLRENRDNWVYKQENKYGTMRKIDPVPTSRLR